MGDGMQVEDQGEWERCRSFRRMFLALTDAGRQDQLAEIATGLLRMAELRLPGNARVVEARGHWESGLLDPSRPDKEQADRVYLVMLGVAAAFGAYRPQTWAGGGEAVVCTAIRKWVPLAPAGFNKVGRLERASGSSSPGEVILEPFRMALIGRSRSE